MKPKFLKPSDKVAIVAPSGRIFREDIQDNFDLLISWGLIPVLGENLFEDYYDGYHYAGTIEQRKSDFQSALDNEDIKAIWCARGGYGAVHLIDKMNWDKFLVNPKWIIGYSDITVFHNHLNNFDVETLHGVTLKKLKLEYKKETFDSLRIALFGGNLNYEIPSHYLNNPGEATGKLVGGNLSLIYSLAGSLSAIQGENLILFIEDWNENWYHLDRMLMNLKRSGLLGKIKGLIAGSFTRMDIEDENPDFLNEYDETSYQLIHKFIEDYHIPVCFQFPTGHIGDNRALIMGSKINLKVSDRNVTLEFY